MRGPILETKRLAKAFGGLMATDDVNLSITSGGCSAIIGPNGAGKSTLFNLLTGFYRADAGDVFYEGRRITNLSIEDRCRMGIARSFQLISIFPALSVYENILFSVLARERRTMDLISPCRRLFREEVSELIENIGLKENVRTPANDLSLGDQKRLEFGVVIAQHPKLLLLDEPTAGMSPVERSATMDFLRNLSEHGNITILLTEHDMDLVFSVSKWIGVLHYGRLIAEGTPDAIKLNETVRKVYLGEQP